MSELSELSAWMNQGEVVPHHMGCMGILPPKQSCCLVMLLLDQYGVVQNQGTGPEETQATSTSDGHEHFCAGETPRTPRCRRARDSRYQEKRTVDGQVQVEGIIFRS